ncbi:MAG: sodium:solute symporter [Candidatus Hydrogenedentes bacterium]|nr:sodium:solute symporter [Candidatus Hydrogenedentota bacterium]
MEHVQGAFGVVDWLVMGLYVAAMLAIGAVSSRRQAGVDSFFLGGRTMPGWAVALSVLATSLSAATFIGAPEISYRGDLSYLILNIGGMIAAFVVAFLFVPPLYRAGTVTIYGYLGKRFGKPSMIAASAMFLLGRLLASGARLFIAAIAFSLILYGDTGRRDLVAAILLFGGIGTVYTVSGGIRAVIWTDTVQIAVVVFVAGLSVYLLLDSIPLSASEIVAALRDVDGHDKLSVLDTRFEWGLPYTLWTGVIASTFVSTASYGTDHDMAQRMMTGKSAWRGGAALIASTALGIPVICLFLAIGLLLSIYYGRPDLMQDAAPSDAVTQTMKIYPQFLLNHLPAGIRGLAMAGVFAAAMSSFDSAINAMASTAVADLYMPWRAWRRRAALDAGENTPAESLRAPRLAVLLMAAVLTCFAILAVFMQEEGGGTLIDFALGVMAFAHAPLLGVFSAALFTRRGNTASVIGALVVGVAGVLLLQSYMLPKLFGFELAWPWWWVIVSPVSFGVCLLGKTTPVRPAPRQDA